MLRFTFSSFSILSSLSQSSEPHRIHRDSDDRYQPFRWSLESHADSTELSKSPGIPFCVTEVKIP